MFLHVRKKFLPSESKYENKWLTKNKHGSFRRMQEATMLNEIKLLLSRSQTLVQDFIGAVALMVVLYGALTFPHLF